MTEIQCQNCSWEWDYTGKRGVGMLTSCPTCGYKVRIPEVGND